MKGNLNTQISNFFSTKNPGSAHIVKTYLKYIMSIHKKLIIIKKKHTFRSIVATL